MIEKKVKKGNLTIYYLKKNYNDEKLFNVLNKKIKRESIKTIIDHDADVFGENGKLLLRFRKNKLNKDNITDFYDNVISFALSNYTTNRGSVSGSKNKNINENPKVFSNILGYFDKLSPKQKFLYKRSNKQLPKITVRETRFLSEHPDKFKKLIPLISEIDKLYKQYIPENYAKQKKKANQTPFHIADTSFTTVTTNVNFQTTVHTDKGDELDGFGNLVVIEHGKYKGGETCYPQYGIGVDVRNGDILYMDVHQPHGNLPIELETKDAIRMSVVCYLRTGIWNQTKGKTKKFMVRHNKTMKKIKNFKHK
jgi:hypothetical protein